LVDIWFSSYNGIEHRFYYSEFPGDKSGGGEPGEVITNRVMMPII